MMYDPNDHQTRCEAYLSRYLGFRVKFIQAKALTKGTREAPWRLDILADGVQHSYVLQLDPKSIEHEYQVLKAMETIQIPTPRVYGLDLQGDALGVPCFFSDFIEGETLLELMLAGEPWAEDLYIEAVCRLQSATEDQLGLTAQSLNREAADDVLEGAYAVLKGESPLADSAYEALKTKMPELPPLCFSNGDLWLENFIVKDRKLVGVIDFANATFSDPIYEFLLSFFVSPELQGRGIEARFCQRIGYDPSILGWYHGLEFFDSLRWVLVTGDDYVHHTKETLEKDLENWLGL